jgi:hypothetical protein
LGGLFYFKSAAATVSECYDNIDPSRHIFFFNFAAFDRTNPEGWGDNFCPKETSPNSKFGTAYAIGM